MLSLPKREKGLELWDWGKRWGLSPSAPVPAAAPSCSNDALCPAGAQGSPCSPSPTLSASRKPSSPCTPGGQPLAATWMESSLCGIHRHPDRRRLHRAAPRQQRRLMPAPGHPIVLHGAPWEVGTH